jgi:hypothetical protein
MSRLRLGKRFGKRKGGASYFSDIIMTISGMGFMFVSVFMTAMVAFFITTGIDATVYGEVLYKNPANENLLMSYMDLTHTETGKPMMELVLYSLLFENSTLEIDGKTIYMEEATSSLMSKMTRMSYHLFIQTEDKRITIGGIDINTFRTKTTAMISAGGKHGELILMR